MCIKYIKYKNYYNDIVIFLMGPTASGKTKLAIEIKKYFPIELISVDSALIYRDMNIGTSKPSFNQLLNHPHHLINIKDPSESYSVINFYYDAIDSINKVINKGKIPLLVGGTMLYYKILLNGFSNLPISNRTVRDNIYNYASKFGSKKLYNILSKIDPIYSNKIHSNDLLRIVRALEVFFISGKKVSELYKYNYRFFPYKILQVAIIPDDRNKLHKIIKIRFEKMLADGFENEVRSLFLRGDLNSNLPSMKCVGYRQMWNYITKKISYDEMIYRSICSTRQLAKRQITWLRKWKNLKFIKNNEVDIFKDIIFKFLTHCNRIK